MSNFVQCSFLFHTSLNTCQSKWSVLFAKKYNMNIMFGYPLLLGFVEVCMLAV